MTVPGYQHFHQRVTECSRVCRGVGGRALALQGRAVNCTRDCTTGTLNAPLTLIHIQAPSVANLTLFPNSSLLFVTVSSHLEATDEPAPPIHATLLRLIPTLQTGACRSINHHRLVQLQLCNEPSLISMTYKPLLGDSVHISTSSLH